MLICAVCAITISRPENIEKYIENNGLKSIIIYNFYALDTIEEKIYKLKSEKNISNFNFSEDEILKFFE